MKIPEDELAKLSRDLVDNVTDLLYDAYKGDGDPDVDLIYGQVEDQLLGAIEHELRLVEIQYG